MKELNKEDQILELLLKMDKRLENVEVGQKNLEMRQQNLEAGQQNLETGQQKLKYAIDKNTILLEKVQSDVQLLAEGHQNIVEQNQVAHDEIKQTIEENYNLQENAIKALAKDIKVLQTV